MPLMITALLPAVMFPLAGVLDSHTVCGKYFNVSYHIVTIVTITIFTIFTIWYLTIMW